MDSGRRLPHPSRLHPDHPRFEEIMRRHDEAVAAGRGDYVDPLSGFTVFTAAALWERGSCCETGCRHCPYVAGDRRDGGSGALA